jgi:ribonuclease BN (tRNA processing enzyme)
MRTKELPKGESLSLTNDGELEIFFLGVGSAFALKHYQLNFLIIKGDAHILVDFGMTGPQALAEVARLKPTDIEVILPTHSHADHIGGLECLALMNRYVGIPFQKKSKLKMIINEAYQEILWDRSLRGGLEANEQLPGDGDYDGPKLSFSDYFQAIRPEWKTLQPRETFHVNYNGIRIDLFRTNHIPEQSQHWETAFVSYGMMIDSRVFMSVDTRFDQDLIDYYAPHSEVMFHDCQFFPGAVHAPLSELQVLHEDVKKKMYLMHIADNWEEQDISGFAGFAQQGVRYIFD